MLLQLFAYTHCAAVVVCILRAAVIASLALSLLLLLAPISHEQQYNIFVAADSNIVGAIFAAVQWHHQCC